MKCNIENTAVNTDLIFRIKMADGRLLMDIKLIVTDLDGTLLRTDLSISERTRNTLSECREKGIKVVYATGREIMTAERVTTKISFDGKIIMNGAVAAINETVIYRRLIPYMIARPLLMACDDYGLKAASQGSMMHYANFIVSDEWPIITNFQVADFLAHEEDAEKLYMIVRNREDALFIEKHLPDELYMSVGRDSVAMVMHREATKSKALAETARFWSIKETEIVAFGDDVNDIDMLTFAGAGVAMGNAIDEAKAAADCVCDTNDNDGIAKWLEDNVLSSRKTKR
jgi:Cof subfamily protein (haloacid dehalogenase superfamily)